MVWIRYATCLYHISRDPTYAYMEIVFLALDVLIQISLYNLTYSHGIFML